MMRRRRARTFITIAAILVSVSSTIPLVNAARGDRIASVTFSQNCASGIGVGIAFDGVNLWYSCYASPTDLYRADSMTGQVTGSYSIAGGLGALAYDTTRNAIWAGWGGSSAGTIYLIHLDTNGNVLTSSPHFSAPNTIVCNLNDGLAYDAQDDSLYISDDCSTTIHHYSTGGMALASFPWAGAGCYNSGLAIGGNLLYQGSNGCGRVWVSDKSSPSVSVFDFSTVVSGDVNFRDEDLECDIFTFADQGLHVMWSKEAYPPMRAHAFEIDFGSCGVGGLPALDSAADLARAVVGAPYLTAGKGWDWSSGQFVDTQSIATGYKFHWSDPAVRAGLDCSGVVYWAYNRSLGATKYQAQPNPVFYEGADGQFNYNSQPVDESDLVPGDLLFFDWDSDNHIDHVAMYVGGDDVVSAPAPGRSIELVQKSTYKALSGFAGFRRVTTPLVYFQVRTHSPVALAVTDPEGFTIDPNTRIDTPEEILHEVPGRLYYSFSDVDPNGNVDDIVSSPQLTDGAYLIRVFPKPGVPGSAVFGLEVETPSGVIALATDSPVSDIPTEGYGVLVDGTSVSTFLPVRIDIKPGGFPNSINRFSLGRVTVAVLTTGTFDALSIDPWSITVADAIVRHASVKDVDSDGETDLVVQVDTADLNLTGASTEAILLGETFDGTPIRGSDSVRIVGRMHRQTRQKDRRALPKRHF